MLQQTAAFGELTADAIDVLAKGSSLVELDPGELLISEGDAGDDLFVLVTGRLEVRVSTEQGSLVDVGELLPFDVVGEVQFVSGGTRSATIVASEACELFRIPGANLREVGDELAPAIVKLTELARRRLYRAQLGRVLDPIVGELPAEVLNAMASRIEWVSLKRGETLFEHGDEADGWYIVVYGRLQVLGTDADGTRELRGEICRGESLGETAILTGGKRNATVVAARDAELVRFRNVDFLTTLESHPAALMTVCKLLATRLSGAHHSVTKRMKGPLYIGVLPCDHGAPSEWVAEELVRSLSEWGTTLHLNPALLLSHGVIRNPEGLPSDHPAWARFASWFHAHSESYAFVVLEATQSAPAWTERVLGYADDTIFVADAAASPAISAFERKALSMGHGGIGSKHVLALVHPRGTARPHGTQKWLADRAPDLHLHVRDENERDVERLARVISGRAVGVVLGGGGARGLAHLGVLRALQEEGVPVDFIGGTSMGAVIGAQYAMGYNPSELRALNWKAIRRQPFRDYTVPMIALLRTQGLDQVAKWAFGETDIEDLWLNYFAVSSDLRHAEIVVHRRGPLWLATRASGALPGIVPPVVDGQRLLVDGGLLNNLPGDIMRRSCGGSVIVVDVTPEFDLPPPEGGIPSGWKLLWNRIMPMAKRIAVPTLFEVLMRSTALSSRRATTRVQQEADLCIRPALERYSLLGFERMEEIIEVGYRAAKAEVANYTGPRLSSEAKAERRPTSLAPGAPSN